MNVVNFDANVIKIERNLDELTGKLNRSMIQTRGVRSLVNNLNIDLDAFVAEESLRDSSTLELWFSAHRITSYDRILAKIDTLSNLLVAAKFQSSSRNSLMASRIGLGVYWEVLKTMFFSSRRLPISEGVERNHYLQKIRDRLHIKDPNDVKYAEKEYFHLLGNQLKLNQWKRAQVVTYEGSKEIYSLSSWQDVLRLMVQNGAKNSTRQVCQNLLDVLDKVESIFLKVSFAYKMLSNPERKSEAELESDYIKQYDRCYNVQDPYTPTTERKEEFDWLFQLSSKCHVPQETIINELVWDILETIDGLKAGEYTLIPLGTANHAILVKLDCVAPAAANFEGEYDYTIFNTGDGVGHWHTIDPAKTSALPFMIQKLPKVAFSYTFFAHLLKIAFTDKTATGFYTAHRTYLQYLSKGFDVNKVGKFYPLQKLGTCCYSSLEVWIHSHFSRAEIQELDRIKAEYAVAKQERAVHLLSTNPQTMQKSLSCKKRKVVKDPDGQPQAKKLKESVSLLEMGKKIIEPKKTV